MGKRAPFETEEQGLYRQEGRKNKIRSQIPGVDPGRKRGQLSTEKVKQLGKKNWTVTDLQGA